MVPKFMQLNSQILEIRFISSYELCNSTYLFSHYYENPDWKGKVFTRLELDEFYEKLHGDPHWWKKRWAGSNLPDKAFERFLSGDFVGLNDFENQLLDAVRNMTAPYYVIMTSNESIYAREHELAHAYYYTDTTYKNKVDEILSIYKQTHSNNIDAAIEKLKNVGYAESVMDDELHAFCGVYYDHYFGRMGLQIPFSMREALINLYKETHHSD